MTSIQLDSGGGAGGGGGGGATNLGYTPSAANGIVTSSTGTSATIPAVDATNAGLMTPAQRAALIAAAGTNLSYTASPTQGVVVSDTGTDATVPAVDATNAGLMIPAQKAAIDALAATYQPLDADLTALAGLAGVQGDVIYRDATQWQRLPAGTSGQFLKTQGAGANPIWAAAGGGSGTAQPRTNLTSGVPFSGVPGAAIFGTASNIGLNADNIYYSGLAVTGNDITITDAVIRVTTAAAAGKNVRLAIYNADADWQPGSLVSDIGAVLVDTTGRKAASGLSITLTPGFYLARVNPEANVTLETWQWLNPWWSGVPVANNANLIYTYAARAYGAAETPGTAATTGAFGNYAGNFMTFVW